MHGKAEKFVVAITGMGIVSPGGHSCAESCATINSGLSRIAESGELKVVDSKGHSVPALCGSVTGVTDGQRRFLRLLRMAVPACAESLENAGLDQSLIASSGLIVCLQEVDRPGMDNRAEESIVDKLGAALDLEGIEARSSVRTEGHAGVFGALQDAFQHLHAGTYSAVIVGAVDTYLDEITLDWLLACKRLKTTDSTRGFLPGEGAAFFVVERVQSAKGRGATAMATLIGPSTAMEPNSMYDDSPCKGDGLSICIQNTLAMVGEEATNTGMIVCDLNGERYRSLEWGLTAPRALVENQIDPLLVHSADCIGDTGAASSAINICYAGLALAKGFAAGGNILVWGSSDDGERGSVFLTSGD